MNPLHPRGLPLAVLLAAALASACATATREPADAVATGAPGHVEADARFMRGMIHHHAQALEMTEIVEERTDSEAIRALARRIEISQEDEIARMERWLEARGEELPGEHLHGELMPGMLTDEQMERLAGARGREFDRLFLELMIQHHEGALVMVEELFHTEGAAGGAEIFQFAAHIDADQRGEIARMRRMLNDPPSGGTR